mmetsp:Transcript_15119/g.26252  ORF Transcript_15119/g.26252 Transcript_15119/m.26252 type:complete len:433 (+) Transcript_15119:125-1423(+)
MLQHTGTSHLLRARQPALSACGPQRALACCPRKHSAPLWPGHAAVLPCQQQLVRHTWHITRLMASQSGDSASSHSPVFVADPSNLTNSSAAFVPASPSQGDTSTSNPAPGTASTAADEPAKKASNFLSATFKSLQDFGLGRSSLSEGGVGLFVMVGIGFAVALFNWAAGTAMRTGHPYLITVELPLACGVTVGTPLRIRGVQVGSVLNVKSSLSRVDVLCEVNDTSTVVPRNSVVEANQSGLIAEPLLDITPQIPLPVWRAGPHQPECAEEGSIVCENGRIKGQPGVALDDLVYIMTRLARQAESEGFDKVFAAAEAATHAIEEARPLLAQSIRLVEEVTPLLRELREGGLVANVEALTSTAAAAAADIQKLQGAILTEDNVRALRTSVITLCRTLEHVESVSSDVSAFTRDSAVQRNLKTLVQALSRLVDE